MTWLDFLIIGWLFVGTILSTVTESRGVWADLLFILLWPIHAFRTLMGWEE